jgi:hypothetical protein
MDTFMAKLSGMVYSAMSDSESDETSFKETPTLSHGNLRLANLSPVVETCQMEAGVTWTRSRNSQENLYVETDSPFHKFLIALDAVRSSRKLCDEGAAIWSALNPQASKIQTRLTAIPFRDKQHLPRGAPDVLIQGVYMNRMNYMNELFIRHARMESDPDDIEKEIHKVPHETDDIEIDESEEENEEQRGNGGKGKEADDSKRLESPVVQIPIHFTSHDEVMRFIENTKTKQTHVLASLSEYEAYLLTKTQISSHLMFINLLRKWTDYVDDKVFQVYETGRTTPEPPIDIILNLRSFLDNRCFFSEGDKARCFSNEIVVGQESGLREIGVARTPYVGLSPTLKSDEASEKRVHFQRGHTKTQAFVDTISLIISEFDHRSQTLLLIQSVLDRYVNAIDEIVVDFMNKLGTIDEDFDEELFIPVSTVRNLINQRNRLFMLCPELFTAHRSK